MNVLVDFHHTSLLHSFILLFEKRLGGKVFRPIGWDWYSQGFWNVYDADDTRHQFLDIGSNPIDGTPPLNQLTDIELGEGVYQCTDTVSGETNKAITFNTFLNTPIDIVIATIPQHIEPFKRLCDMHPNKPKLIYQIGNAWNIPDTGIVKNVMSSAIVPNVPSGINYVQYHQEFPLEHFNPDRLQLTDEVQGKIRLTYPERNVYSFINCFGVMDHFKEDYELFLQMERLMPEWNFKSFGGQCRDGSMTGARDLASKMRESRFIWHTKKDGDGYGHVLHNAAAVGKPVIIRRKDYSGKLGDKLLIDGKTCIEIDNLSPEGIVDKILYFSFPDRYMIMTRSVYYNFKEVVDFDREAEEIKVFLHNLI